MSEHDSDSNTHTESGAGGSGWLLGVVGALIFYLLSPGPLVTMYSRSTKPPTWALVYVAPIEWCCERSSTFEKYYGKYLELWRRR